LQVIYDESNKWNKFTQQNGAISKKFNRIMLESLIVNMWSTSYHSTFFTYFICP